MCWKLLSRNRVVKFETRVIKEFFQLHIGIALSGINRTRIPYP